MVSVRAGSLSDCCIEKVESKNRKELSQYFYTVHNLQEQLALPQGQLPYTTNILRPYNELECIMQDKKANLWPNLLMKVTEKGCCSQASMEICVLICFITKLWVYLFKDI